jgi:hypothetical protein
MTDSPFSKNLFGFPDDEKRSAWSLVGGTIVGAVIMAFVGGNGSSDQKQALFDDKAWPTEVPVDQEEALFELCLANGGAELICEAQQRVISLRPL